MVVGQDRPHRCLPKGFFQALERVTERRQGQEGGEPGTVWGCGVRGDRLGGNHGEWNTEVQGSWDRKRARKTLGGNFWLRHKSVGVKWQ